MSIKQVEAKFGFNAELGEILLSYTSVNMIFKWLFRILEVEDNMNDLLYDNDSNFSVLFDDIEKQKIMVIIKLLISNVDNTIIGVKFPSNDSTIMANAIGLVLMTAKGFLNDIKKAFYGYMEYLENEVASGELTEHVYKNQLDTCKFIGEFLDKLEFFDWENKITGYWVNNKNDGEQCLIIKYKDSSSCCCCSCHCRN